MHKQSKTPRTYGATKSKLSPGTHVLPSSTPIESYSYSDVCHSRRLLELGATEEDKVQTSTDSNVYSVMMVSPLSSGYQDEYVQDIESSPAAHRQWKRRGALAKKDDKESIGKQTRCSRGSGWNRDLPYTVPLSTAELIRLLPKRQKSPKRPCEAPDSELLALELCTDMIRGPGQPDLTEKMKIQVKRFREIDAFRLDIEIADGWR